MYVMSELQLITIQKITIVGIIKLRIATMLNFLLLFKLALKIEITGNTMISGINTIKIEEEVWIASSDSPGPIIDMM